MLDEVIKERAGFRLGVEKRSTDAGVDVIFRLRSEGNFILHWALAQQHPGRWQLPPKTLWPEDTRAINPQAVQTPFTGGPEEKRVSLRLKHETVAPFLVFDVFCADTNRWENNQGRDFYLPLSELEPAPSGPKPGVLLDQQPGRGALVFRKDYALDSGGQLATAVTCEREAFYITLLTDVEGPVALHWGVLASARAPWRLPDEAARPAGTRLFGDVSVETPFDEAEGLRRLTWTIPVQGAPPAIGFVLHQTASNQWLKHRGQNMVLRIAMPAASGNPLDALAARIVEGEMGEHGWTLMHRYNLCHELIEEAGGARDAWATLFVWLRYSAIRQLDWQRNYNTKPRELSHAQDRLTARLADAFIRQAANRDLIRQMLACLGRGGDGQRIRDDILHIMHRHHIKEVGGTWMEQWHQKLHNNTTPDDVVICEAYLAFLHGNGDLRAYDQTLLAGGVTRERLAGFERPITQNPEWHPQLKEGLLHDFGNYLVLLKSVHSGTDLSTAINAGGHLLDGGSRDTLGWVLHHFQSTHVPVPDLAAAITSVRCRLHARLKCEGSAGVVKELIYLDLALEQALRTVIERATHASFTGEALLQLIDHGVTNLLLVTGDDAELQQCQREWRRLPADGRFNTDWALHAKAALDRLRRAVEGQIDRAYQLLQPRAELLGKEFSADAWVVRLFSEEVVRGQSVFLLSMLIHHFDPILRKLAKLGDWQVISPSSAAGEVQVIEEFRSVQGRRFERPTIIVAEKVSGDEEPPEGVRAVITPSSVDLVSHVAVRARNASLLFATCYDRATFDQLKAAGGRVIELKVSATGDVLYAESAAKVGKTTPRGDARPAVKAVRASRSLDVLSMADFAKGRVGGKSWHLKELAAKLPGWLHTPRSVALPFGVFDAVLAERANAAVAKQYQEWLERLPKASAQALTRPAGPLPPSNGDRGGVDTPESILARVRSCLLGLALPQSLRSDVEAIMRNADLKVPNDFSLAATRIKQVWASKWNDRAYFSRQARGFPHEAVQMAVLIQEVIEAEFAFVIHTVNPFNGNRDEIYAEVVFGLGETLVGNYPGRALSFVCPKQGGSPTVLAYPSKSVGLFGSGLIFRSDSNAEDLEGYAGAGLYDSVLLEEPREETLDYTTRRLVWEPAARNELLGRIAEIGDVVERAFGSPQDIEGAFSQGRFSVVQTRPQVGL